jgi:hypothetical protein
MDKDINVKRSIYKKNQKIHIWTLDDYFIWDLEVISLLKYANLKQKHLGYQSVMFFMGKFESGSNKIYEISAEFTERTYTNVFWSTLCQNEPLFSRWDWNLSWNSNIIVLFELLNFLNCFGIYE